MKLKAVWLLALVAGWLGAAQTVPLAERIGYRTTVPKTFEQNGQKLQYRLHAPQKTEAGRKYPLLVYLHGMGQRGEDNVAQVLHCVDEMLGYADRKHIELFFIAPQVPPRKHWKHDDIQALLIALVERSLADLPIDPSRVYLTGQSMGGFGTWKAIQTRPDLFAAAIPVCGGGDPAQAAKIKDLPIWCFHGALDNNVPTKYTRDMYGAIRSYGGIVRYREYANLGHWCHQQTYSNDEVLDWLFAQRKTVEPAR